MLPGNDTWPESLQALYEQVVAAPREAVLSARTQWAEQLGAWVQRASLDEREMARVATWARLEAGPRSAGELVFLLSHCGELLWPYSEAPDQLLQRLLSRQVQLFQGLKTGDPDEGLAPLARQVSAELSKVVLRYLKRHPEALLSLVGGVGCTFDGRVLRFQEAVEVDLKVFLGPEKRLTGRLDQLRMLLPHLREGRYKLMAFIRERAAKLPWRECRDILEEKLFQVVTAPDSRGELRGFLGCYAKGKGEARWCTRASLLLSRNLEEGGPLAVAETSVSCWRTSRHPSRDCEAPCRRWWRVFPRTWRSTGTGWWRTSAGST
ncbi:hypothetical protein [Stigmatella aurantiaca]|uniref:Uncharacterized protein n=1 Tax=Stigmatella aurantiaca (strain DW4/3-1) TaxID=378806 RepID=Q097V0_STIAD|nr:hypothetical protein [Stigmatella aurantiaca]EAU67973.1 hypothetical protein STIAU_0805 [Stigmatella aurantiaca DW4/3-1]